MIEMINTDNLTNCLKHKGVKEETKTLLRAYKRMLYDGNKVKVAYDYGKNYKKEKLGRVYAKHSLGLQEFPRDVRAALAKDYYWDIDTVCCQPTLLDHYCTQHNISCPTLKEYIERRKEVLTEVMEHYDVPYEDAKELFNRGLYLGGENNWKRDLNRCQYTTHPFVKRFFDEIGTIARVVLLNDPGLQQKINKVKGLAKDAKGFETIGAVMSFTLQSLEHSVLCAMVEFFESHGRSVDVLIFDGCLIRIEAGEEEFPIELLAELSEFVEERIGLAMQFSVKPLETTLVFDDENLSSDVGEDGMINDLFATRKFVEIMGECIQRDGGDVFVFNNSNGLWEKGEDCVRAAIVRNASKLVFEETIGTRKVTHDYGGVVSKQNQIIKLLLAVMPDTQYIERNKDTSVGKLLFADGIFDCNDGSFRPGFDPNVVFLARIDRPFPNKRRFGLEKLINKTLFIHPFSKLGELDTETEMGLFYKNALAYAMVGDYSHKKMYIILGDSNSGKGVITDAVKAAFGRYTNTFNGKDLAYNRRNGSDSAKQLLWIADKLHSRILIANEMEMDKGVAINGNLIKTLASGGDCIDVRKNFENPGTTKLTQTVFLFANDCPPITPIDSGIFTRMRYIRFTKHFVDKPIEECSHKELPADADLKKKVQSPEWCDSLFWILYEAYSKIRGKPYWSPACVVEETKDFIGEAQDVRKCLLERYTIGEEECSENDVIPFSEIKDYLNNECGFNGTWSDNRIGRELTDLGLEKKYTRYGGKMCSVRTHIKHNE